MILYKYEGEVLKFINNFLPEIKDMTYATDEDLLLAMSDIKYFPSFFYRREEMDWTNNKVLSVSNGSQVVKFCTFEQKYIGSIIVENQKDAQILATNLRFYWDKVSTVSIDFIDSEKLAIQLRLLYIKIKEVRRPNDKKGSCRIVEFGWQSNLFMNPLTPDTVGLVERVNIKLVNDEVVVIPLEDIN